MARIRKVSLIFIMAILVINVAAVCGLKTRVAAASPGVVTIGFAPAVSLICFDSLPQVMHPTGFTIQTKVFKSSQDMLIATITGAVDMATVGYDVTATAMANNPVRIKYIAGVSKNGGQFIARKGSGITTWTDLRGKRFGGVSGSSEFYQMQAALASHGLVLGRDVQFTNFSQAADVMLALQHGDIDATISYEPVVSQAVEAGYAVRAAAIQGDLFKASYGINSGLVANADFVQAHPDWVQEIMNAYVSNCKKIKTDPEYAVAQYQQLGSPGNPRILLDAFKASAEAGTYDWNLYGGQVQTMVKRLLTQKAINKDVTAPMLGSLDYDFLSKATGEPPSQLGAATH